RSAGRCYSEAARAGTRAGSGSPWRASRKQLAAKRGERAWECWLGAALGHEGGFLDLVDRPLLAAVLDPARAAAGAQGDRVQTEGEGDQGRSAQRAAWHDRTSLVVSLVDVGWLHGRAAGAPL